MVVNGVQVTFALTEAECVERSCRGLLQHLAGEEVRRVAARLDQTMPSAGLLPRHTGSAHPAIIKFDPDKEFDDLFLVQCDLSFDSMCFEFSESQL